MGSIYKFNFKAIDSGQKPVEFRIDVTNDNQIIYTNTVNDKPYYYDFIGAILYLIDVGKFTKSNRKNEYRFVERKHNDSRVSYHIQYKTNWNDGLHSKTLFVVGKDHKSRDLILNQRIECWVYDVLDFMVASGFSDVSEGVYFNIPGLLNTYRATDRVYKFTDYPYFVGNRIFTVEKFEDENWCDPKSDDKPFIIQA